MSFKPSLHLRVQRLERQTLGSGTRVFVVEFDQHGRLLRGNPNRQRGPWDIVKDFTGRRTAWEPA